MYLPCCGAFGKAMPISGPQSPQLCTKRGWCYFCNPFQFQPLSELPTPMLALALPLSSCQKEEKKLALGVRGGRAAPSCQGARLLLGERTSHKSQDREVPPPRNHSYPATPLTQTQPEAPPRTTSKVPRDHSPPCDQPQLETEQKPTPHCAEVETEAGRWRLRGLDSIRSPVQYSFPFPEGRSVSFPCSWSFHVGEIESSTVAVDRGPTAMSTLPSHSPDRETETQLGAGTRPGPTASPSPLLTCWPPPRGVVSWS